MLIRTSKKTNRRSIGSKANQHVGQWSLSAQSQFRKVSKENREEFRKEKTVQELTKQGFNEAAISGMTTLPESSVKTLMKNTGKNIVLDGRY